MLNRRLVGLALMSAPLAQAQAQARRLRVAVQALPPHVMEAGHPAGDGIDVDIVRSALALSGRYEIQLERLPWRRVLAQLESGNADLTISARATPERRRFLGFSRGYGGNVLHDFYALRERGELVRRLEDLGALRIGVVAGFAFPPRLRAAFGPRIEQALHLESLMRMVAANRVDVAVINSLPGRWLSQELGLESVLARQPFSHDSGDQTHVAVALRSPGATELLADLDRGLAQLARQGWQRFESPYIKPLPMPAVPRRAGAGGSG